MEKYGTARQATDDNIAHAHCMLDNEVSRHALRICIYYCSTAKMGAQTRPDITLHIHYVTHTLCLFFNDKVGDPTHRW